MAIDRLRPEEPWMHRLETAGELQQATFLIFQALGAEAHARMELGIGDSDRAKVALERIKALGEFISTLIVGEPYGAERQPSDA